MTTRACMAFTSDAICGFIARFDYSLTALTRLDVSYPHQTSLSPHHNSASAFSASATYFSDLYLVLSHPLDLPSSIFFLRSAALISTGVKDQKLLDWTMRLPILLAIVELSPKASPFRRALVEMMDREARSACATVVAIFARCRRVMWVWICVRMLERCSASQVRSTGEPGL